MRIVLVGDTQSVIRRTSCRRLWYHLPAVPVDELGCDSVVREQEVIGVEVDIRKFTRARPDRNTLQPPSDSHSTAHIPHRRRNVANSKATLPTERLHSYNTTSNLTLLPRPSHSALKALQALQLLLTMPLQNRPRTPLHTARSYIQRRHAAGIQSQRAHKQNAANVDGAAEGAARRDVDADTAVHQYRPERVEWTGACCTGC